MNCIIMLSIYHLHFESMVFILVRNDSLCSFPGQYISIGAKWLLHRGKTELWSCHVCVDLVVMYEFHLGQ